MSCLLLLPRGTEVHIHSIITFGSTLHVRYIYVHSYKLHPPEVTNRWWLSTSQPTRYICILDGTKYHMWDVKLNNNNTVGI